MLTRTIFSVVLLASLMSVGCGGGNGDKGSATLRGVVVDGNPYVDRSKIEGLCSLNPESECLYKDTLPPAIKNTEVRIWQIKGDLYTGDFIKVATVLTDSEGRFSATLPPGVYVAYSDLPQEKGDDYCAGSGYADLADGDDKSVVIGNDGCFVFPTID